MIRIHLALFVLLAVAASALGFPTWNSGSKATQFAVADQFGMTFVNSPATGQFVVPQGGYANGP